MNGQKIPDWIFSVFLFFSQLDCLAWDNYWKVEWANKIEGKLAGANKQAGPVPPPLIQILAGAMPRKNRSDAQG